ncbi:uncharacterized protein LOC105444076 [Strongylocentrotus purpuratus]|uniref:Uncharacterized protein n=1 Tax=Strongylocentrotus purpuratus TaxID=7668 RepID=A0A7M7HLR4_STRPU|nr:uncharacterized protein LOC105444076 [Strongylocentrotus purpuratus]|eukprot:XP_011676160.1 PREDICTED: uncharacterized protein LOC105444076 [Strongylocentrotus purpuratus]
MSGLYVGVWAGTGEPPVQQTTAALDTELNQEAPTTIPSGNGNEQLTTLLQTNPKTTEGSSTEAATLTVPTTDELIPDTTQPQPSTQHTMTSQTLTDGTQTTEKHNMTVTQKPLEVILTACFDNATEGEASAKPYRPLSFSSGTETDRLSVSFYSPFLQTKPGYH